MSKDDLNLLIDAVRADVPDDSQTSGAQFRLQRALANHQKEKRSMSTILLTFAGTRAALVSLAGILTLTTGLFFGVSPTGPSMAFAAVLEQIRELDTYSSTVTVETHGQQTVQQTVTELAQLDTKADIRQQNGCQRPVGVFDVLQQRFRTSRIACFCTARFCVSTSFDRLAQFSTRKREVGHVGAGADSVSRQKQGPPKPARIEHSARRSKDV